MDGEELNEEVLRLTREGLGRWAVAARLNIPVAEVKRRLEVVGFPVTRPDYYKGTKAADIRREIVRLHFEGKTPEMIAHELRTNLGYVVRRLHQADLTPRAEPEQIERAKERHEKILDLGREGVPRHEIAERLEVPWFMVAETLDKVKIKPILPACADIATWARTLTPIIKEIRVSVPNAEPILAKADRLEKKLVAVIEAAAKAQEMIPLEQENSEYHCLTAARFLIDDSIKLVDALKGCIEQREVEKLPKLLDQAENCIKNASDAMTRDISRLAEEASIAGGEKGSQVSVHSLIPEKIIEKERTDARDDPEIWQHFGEPFSFQAADIPRIVQRIREEHFVGIEGRKFIRYYDTIAKRQWTVEVT